MYFGSFPTIPYDSKGNGELKMVTNLLRRVAIRSKIKDNLMMYDTYDIKNGDTIIKYGNDIGRAIEDIPRGGYVHVHNVKTKRW